MRSVQETNACLRLSFGGKRKGATLSVAIEKNMKGEILRTNTELLTTIIILSGQ
jgi:hypothetical protein